MSRRRPVRGTAAALLSAGLVAAVLPVAGPARAADTPAAPAAGTARTVTLVTGDEVTVTDLAGGHRTVTVERPRGATGAVRTQSDDGEITVVPDEARPYLRAGTLDRRLFDVSALLRQGLGDSATGELPLILTRAPGARALTPRSAERTRTLPSIRGIAVEAAKGRDFWGEFTRHGSGVGAVWLDGRVTADMAESNARIGTAAAWEAGLTGKGVTVAVLDTGVDPDHPDLADRVAVSRNFVEGEEGEPAADRNGHGTHVASTAGGSGAASDGREKGVAPGATLAVGKVLGDQGSGSESQIIAGMEWAAREVHADVVSMSLGTTEPSDGTDPMARALDTLSAETGALFVVAAGNTGTPSSIGSPGAADAALTVGAVDSADRPASFTSAGPRHGDHALKPDLSAPGVDILAARSRLTAGSGYYTTLSGTSMATPHVAGVAALLAEQHPDWTGTRLKDALMSTSARLDAPAYTAGAGRVSVPDAIGARVTATGSADLGFHRWPPATDRPVTRTLTYANSSGTDTVVRLSVTGAPEGVVTLADTTLTVPAHGTASTTVTGDATRAPAGLTSGRVEAADATGTPLAHTAFGLVEEDERYTLTVHVKDRDGTPAAADLTVQRLARGADATPEHVGDTGTLTLRLPPGTYSLTSFLDVRGGHGADSLGLGFLAAPEVVLDRDREVTLDGSRLREVRADVGRRTETRQLLMEYDRSADGTDLSGAVQVPVAYDSVFAAPTDRVTRGRFEYRTVWRLGAPALRVTGVREAVVQPGGARPAGHRTLPLADAGEWPGPAPGALAGAAGEAVLVRLADGADPVALAQAAQEAGVAALFVTDDVPGRLTAWWGTDDGGDRPFPVATLDTADAARLRARPTAVLTGTPDTPWVYDLSEGHAGAVPDRDLTYTPPARELATVDVRFHAPGPRSGGEFRYSLTDAFPLGIGFLERVGLPALRTDHVSTGPGQLWHESVTAGDGALEERSGPVAYRGGSHPVLNWFRPVWHPWLGTGLGRGQQRSGNTLRFDVPGWGDSGPDHTGSGDAWSEESGMTQTTSVLLDGALVDRRRGSGVTVQDAPADARTYTVVTDTALDAGRWSRASQGHAEWTVRSAATPEDHWTYLPLINLSFAVDTDLAGDVRGGSRVPVGLGARYVAGAAGTGTPGGGTLAVSYDDGATWRPVPLTGGAGTWHGTLAVPRGAASVSLRASAHDDRGGSVTQTLVRAIGVR
ncbi:S8 family serine peptidase [Streptomyces galbus]|uniref:Peptidase S8 n=1 Tax=Streptomyces galbus TaxID=33898 RepID=A0A4V6AYD6_STRGB|nr:S8 family serine peptidase [Streptomyces galbus]TKT11133.1 peptidase S8 [Streptomyces galbus]GHD29981.1 peptidase [Streptomyces galbus]